MSPSERNTAVRNNPELLRNIILAAKANRTGGYRTPEGVAYWKPSFLPYHIHYTLFYGEDKDFCEHLVSTNNENTKSLV